MPRKTAKRKPAIRRASLRDLESAVEQTVRYVVDCCICGIEEEDNDSSGTAKDFAAGLAASGWTYGDSEKYAVEGAMCPECSGTPDTERGDE